MLFVSLLIVATASAIPVPSTNRHSRSGIEELEDVKHVSLPPSLPPPNDPQCTCELCQGGVIPPYEIVGQITDSHGNPLLIVNPNGSGEDISWFSGEDGDYFSGEFSPEEIQIFCSENPTTPECQEFFASQPQKVVNINIIAPPAPPVDGGVLKPSLPPVVNPLVPNVPNPQQPTEVDLTSVDQLAPVDPPTKNAVVVPPTSLVDPNFPNIVDPLPANPLEPLPLASVDQSTVDPLVSNTDIPLDVVGESQLPVTQANLPVTFGNLVFPQKQPDLSSTDPSVVFLNSPDTLSPNLLSGGTDGQSGPTIDTRIT